MSRPIISLSSLFLSFLVILILVESKKSSMSSENRTLCLKNKKNVNGSIGVVIDERSRLGKEQRIGMEMALHDLSHCSNLNLLFKDSYGSSTKAASAAIELASHKQVHAIVGPLTLQQAELISQLINKDIRNIPILSTSPIASTPFNAKPKLSSFIQMTNDVIYQAKCIAAIISHFKWPKVISMEEQCNVLSEDYELITSLSDSLQAVNSSVEQHVSFPCLSSLSDPGAFIEKELNKLANKDVRIFVLLHSSLEFSKILFDKANARGMMEKSYVWIVSDEIANFLDIVDVSVILNMQGVIGLKRDYIDGSDEVRKFTNRFRKKYVSKYPEDEENSIPSMYALRAYDAIWTIANSLEKTKQMSPSNSKELLNNILSTRFDGLSGEINFRNGMLSKKSVFRIINVVGRGYKEVQVWSPEFGFSKDLLVLNKGRFGSGSIGGLSSINWPGGEANVPIGTALGTKEKPLNILVPAKGAFTDFVKVTYVQSENRNLISGLSIDIFEVAVKALPYDLNYVFIPYYGSYDEMVAEVRNKSLYGSVDGAVGDIEIMSYRYEYATFTQPYLESGLQMVVPAKSTVFLPIMDVFTAQMWVLLAVSWLSVGAIVKFCEHVAEINDDFFQKHLHDQILAVLQLALTVPYVAFRGEFKNIMSYLVVMAWVVVVVVVGSSFTASLSSMLTIPRLRPSIENIKDLQRNNAVVGCNGNSFIVQYLIDVLKFKPENVRRINSIHEYPYAFRRGDIEAAFFVAPHAKVFLGQYCDKYINSGPMHKLGGFGFVFPKGSRLVDDISEAILKVTQSGQVAQIVPDSPSNCTPPPSKSPIGIMTFATVFSVFGCIVAIALLSSIILKFDLKVKAISLAKKIGSKAKLLWAMCFTKFSALVNGPQPVNEGPNIEIVAVRPI